MQCMAIILLRILWASFAFKLIQQTCWQIRIGKEKMGKRPCCFTGNACPTLNKARLCNIRPVDEVKWNGEVRQDGEKSLASFP